MMSSTADSHLLLEMKTVEHVMMTLMKNPISSTLGEGVR